MYRNKYELVYIIVLIFLCLLSLYGLLQTPRTNITVQYDCQLAEISPDYPQEVKQKCRELVNEHILSR